MLGLNATNIRGSRMCLNVVQLYTLMIFEDELLEIAPLEKIYLSELIRKNSTHQINYTPNYSLFFFNFFLFLKKFHKLQMCHLNIKKVFFKQRIQLSIKIIIFTIHYKSASPLLDWNRIMTND